MSRFASYYKSSSHKSTTLVRQHFVAAVTVLTAISLRDDATVSCFGFGSLKKKEEVPVVPVQSSKPTIYKLDYMHENPQEFSKEEIYNLAKHMAERDPENYELLWRFARAAYSWANEDPNLASDKKKELIMFAAKTMSDVKAKLRNNNHVYRWAGITLSATADYKPTADGIKDAYIIRDDFVQAIAIDPYDASAHHLLGRWAYSVATLSWVKRNLANTFFASPPIASLNEALESFETAEKLQPGFWKDNQLWLAKTCDALGDKPKAIEWLLKALESPVVTESDKKAQKESLDLLKKLDSKLGKEAETKEKQRLADLEALREEKARSSLR